MVSFFIGLFPLADLEIAHPVGYSIAAGGNSP